MLEWIKRVFKFYEGLPTMPKEKIVTKIPLHLLVGPKDILVLQTKNPISVATQEHIRREFEDLLNSDKRVVFLQGEWEIGVIERKEDNPKEMI